jgi:peptidyl-prolyl cis-trans isomerase C
MLRRWLAIPLLLLTACSQTDSTATPAPTTAPPVATAPPTALPIPGTATPTPEPLAARVNDQPIPLAAYQAEVQRCESANAFPDCPARVLQSLIEQASVEQAAIAAGLSVSDEEVLAEIAELQTAQGSAEAYAAWLAANGYTDESFREALRRDLLRARMAAKVTEPVGDTAEHVHALVILVADEATARSLLDQLRAGADFGTLAVNNSLDLSTRVAGGDAGWFPRGTLTQPEVEQTAFALQPGETSDVIQSALGYYLIRVLERDPVRALSPAARQTLLIRTYEVWLNNLLAESKVERLINP